MGKFKSFYLKEDIINSADVNLQSLYSGFNKRLFNNELPKVPMKFNKSKRYGGEVVYSITKNKITNFIISTLIEYEEDEFYGLFLHEMIHVYLFNKGILKTSGKDKIHGKEFMDKLKELEKKSKFKIPVTEDVTHKKISVKNKEKMFDILLIYDKNKNDYGILVFKDGYLKDKKIELNELYKNMLAARPEFKISAHKSNNLNLLKYPTKRNFKNLPPFVIDNDTVKQIIKSGKKLYDVGE